METTLSKRELRVARQVARGRTQKEIAKRMFISRHTVNNHLANIYNKLHIHNEADLTRWYILHECYSQRTLFNRLELMFLTASTI